MTNLIRKNQKIFAQNALNNGQFGSLQLGTKINSSDPEVLQSLAAYDNGWDDAVVSGDDLPSLEEFQGLQYKTDYQLSYLLNKGIPEWDSQSEYFIGDIQREVGGTKIYKSITDNNIGNILTDVVNWELLADLSGIQIPSGSIVLWTTSIPPSGYLECDGSTVSRTVYSKLFTAIGDDYGIGDGATTFNIPDLRGKFPRGWDHGVGNDPDAASRIDRGDGTTGDNIGTLQNDAFQGHYHKWQGSTNNISGGGGSVNADPGTGSTRNDTKEAITDGVNGTPRISSETRPLNINLMYIIKY